MILPTDGHTHSWPSKRAKLDSKSRSSSEERPRSPNGQDMLQMKLACGPRSRFSVCYIPPSVYKYIYIGSFRDIFDKYTGCSPDMKFCQHVCEVIFSERCYIRHGSIGLRFQDIGRNTDSCRVRKQVVGFCDVGFIDRRETLTSPIQWEINDYR